MLRMPGELIESIDQKSLPAEVAELIARLQRQARDHAQELAGRDREIAWRDAKIDKLNFELARGALPEAGGGISGLGSKGQGMGRSQRRADALVGELVRARAALARTT